jgi:hypothetical protein
MSDPSTEGPKEITPDGAPWPPVDIQPGSYVRVPKGATEKDLSRIGRSIQDAKLNERIRKAYQTLKDESGRFPDGFRAAREEVAQQFAVSEARVRRAVSGA